MPGDYSFSDFTILLRTKRLLPPLEEAFSRSGIPYDSFADNMLLADPRTIIITLCLKLFEKQDEKESIKPKIEMQFKKVQPAMKQNDLDEMVDSLIKTICEIPADETVRAVIGILAEKIELLFADENWSDRGVVAKLESFAAPFHDRFSQFLDALALQKESDSYDARADRVNVMTLHASKGLEFAVVFIIGCEESIIPLRFGGNDFDIDEERRLLYVGMTRAQRHLYLSHAKTRSMFGRKKQQSPSRFLAAISDQLLQRDRMNSWPQKKNTRQLKLF